MAIAGKNQAIGEPAGTRTRDHRIKSAMLYQLSYRPAFSLWHRSLQRRRYVFVLCQPLGEFCLRISSDSVPELPAGCYRRFPGVIK
jgi:hypothetical protein